MYINVYIYNIYKHKNTEIYRNVCGKIFVKIQKKIYKKEKV